MRNYAISVWVVAAVTCYLAPIVTWWLAFPVALVAIELPIYVTGLAAGLITGRENQQRLNGIVLWLLLAGASYAALMSHTWLRFVGALFVPVAALIVIPARRLILGFAIAAPLIAVALFIERRWMEGIVLIATSHALILYPTLQPNCQWLGPVFTHFDTDRDEVWLTIDDGPADDTPAIREMLDRRGVPATFFVIGRHDGANHSATHPSATFWCLGPRRIAKEIDGGASSKWFRAPVGMKNPFVHPALAKRGMRLIGWSVRGFDATRGDVDAIVRRIVARVTPGAIVVMHQGRPWSLRAIERVVDELQQRGYAFVIPSDERLKTKR